jgi:hypothetical protein
MNQPSTSEGEVERYAARADEMSEGGQYSWWCGLATLLRSQADTIARMEGEYEKVLNSYADENQRLFDRAEASEARLSQAEETFKRIAAIKYPNDTLYAHRAMIDYARDQADAFLKDQTP